MTQATEEGKIYCASEFQSFMVGEEWWLEVMIVGRNHVTTDKEAEL